MKALWITYDMVLDEEIIRLLDEFQVAGFTRWPRLSGRGPRSGARLDNHVWPGANAAIVTVLDDERSARLLVRLQELRDRVGDKTGVWAFTAPVGETLA